MHKAAGGTLMRALMLGKQHGPCSCCTTCAPYHFNLHNMCDFFIKSAPFVRPIASHASQKVRVHFSTLQRMCALSF